MASDPGEFFNFEVEVAEAAADAKIAATQNELAAVRARYEDARKRADALAVRNYELEERLGIREALSSIRIEAPEWQSFPKGTKTGGKVTAWEHFSDWHFMEVVRPELMNGHNAYDMAIAQMRLDAWVENGLTVADSLGGSYEWEGLVLSINGDIWNGWIHDSRASNDTFGGLFKDLRVLSGLIAGAIEKKADYYGWVTVYVTVGNHARLSHKWDPKHSVADNCEYELGKQLQDHFALHPNVEVHVAESVDILFDIYHLQVCQSHGNTGVGQSGINTVYGPWSRIERLGQNKRHIHSIGSAPKKRPRKVPDYVPPVTGFHVITIGHYHLQRMAAMGYDGYCANGTAKGYDEFARDNGMRPERPVQGFTIVHPVKGIIGQFPIWVADRKAEGW